uniref:Uncharacterized protein n=1 Tax=Solanum tuberosum TaxID=4113 RepID=M0ZKZ7_SOLTU
MRQEGRRRVSPINSSLRTRTNLHEHGESRFRHLFTRAEWEFNQIDKLYGCESRELMRKLRSVYGSSTLDDEDLTIPTGLSSK